MENGLRTKLSSLAPNRSMISALMSPLRALSLASRLFVWASMCASYLWNGDSKLSRRELPRGTSKLKRSKSDRLPPIDLPFWLSSARP